MPFTRPDVLAKITNRVMFTSLNDAARADIRPDVLATDAAFPPDEYRVTKVQFDEVRRQETHRAMTRAFTKFLSGM